MGTVGGTWRGSFTGTFERKAHMYLGSFSWTQKTLKVKSWGHLDQGCPELISDHAAQRA